MRVLVAAGKTAEAKRANQRYIKRVEDTGRVPPEILARIKSTLAYFLGEPNRIAKLSSAERSSPNVAQMIRFVDGMESGDPARVGELEKTEKEMDNGPNMLMLGLAWQVAGDKQAAKRCFDTAADKFASGDQEDRETSRLMKMGDTLKLTDANGLLRSRISKSMILTALAASSPSNRTELLDRAEKLNILGGFPHHLIKKAIASLRTGQ
jgi:hypothetical protein